MRAVLYARVSTSKQAERDLSIPDQVHQMLDWCKREGHEVTNEFREEGTGTDDHRPEFQKMMADAHLSPPPFNLIVVHSLSMFFRNHFELLMFEKSLRKNHIQLIPITQLTSDDSNGEMMRNIFALFDEYSKKVNAKHTVRGDVWKPYRRFFRNRNHI